MRGIEARISRLEARQGTRSTANIWEPRMVKVTLRRFAREVAAGTRTPEDATEATALAELWSIPVAAGASLAERMEAAILRNKPQREQGRSA